MDGGAWWATVHRAAKELDMTEWLNINNKPLYLLAKVFFSLFCPQECWGPRAGLWWHRESWKWKDSKGITTISYTQGRGHTQKGHQDHTFPFSFLLISSHLSRSRLVIVSWQLEALDWQFPQRWGQLGLSLKHTCPSHNHMDSFLNTWLLIEKPLNSKIVPLLVTGKLWHISSQMKICKCR